MSITRVLFRPMNTTPPVAPPARLRIWRFLKWVLVAIVIPIVVAAIGAGWFVHHERAGEWVPLPLGESWQQQPNFETVAVMKDSVGIVHIKGAVSVLPNKSPSDFLATLPQGYHPNKIVEGAVGGGSGGQPGCAMQVTPEGRASFSGCGREVYLDGFSFPASNGK